MVRFSVIRSIDGKMASQPRFFGPVHWGKGKLYTTRKGAEKLLRDIEYKSKTWLTDKTVQNLGTVSIKVWGNE
jgi:hypothetical protein